MKFDLRRAPRLRLKRSAPATSKFGVVEIFDVTPGGLGIAHDFRLEKGAQLWLEFTWAGRPLRLECEVRSTQRRANETKQRSGLVIRGGASADEYRRLVERELEKMKAAQTGRPSTI